MNHSDLDNSEKRKPKEIEDSSKSFVDWVKDTKEQNEEISEQQKLESLEKNKKRNFSDEMNFLTKKKTQCLESSDEHIDIALQIAELIKTTELDIIREKEKEIKTETEKELEKGNEKEIKTETEKELEKEIEKEIEKETETEKESKIGTKIQIEMMEHNSQIVRNVKFDIKKSFDINNKVIIEEEKKEEIIQPLPSFDNNSVLSKENITNMNNLNNITMKKSIEIDFLANNRTTEEKKKEIYIDERNQKVHEKEKENSLKEQIGSIVETMETEKEKPSIETDDTQKTNFEKINAEKINVHKMNVEKMNEKCSVLEKETNELGPIMMIKESSSVNDKIEEREKKNDIHIEIPYCISSSSNSSSERSGNESEQESSVESLEDSYGRMYNQGILLDTHTNYVKENMAEEDKTSAQILFNSLSDTKEEMKVLNEFIHDIINVNQENNTSSSIEIDGKLMNILSFSFLTFVDHVINDSHVYAINKEEETQENQIQREKTRIKTNEHIFKSSSIISPSINDPSENNKSETLNKIEQNTTDRETSSSKMIFDINVINECLHNMYNEEIVQQKKREAVMKKEKEETQGNASSHFVDYTKDVNAHKDKEVKVDQSNKVENNINMETTKFHIKKNVIIERNKQIQKINDKINDNKMKCNNEAITSNEVKKSKYSIYDIFDI